MNIFTYLSVSNNRIFLFIRIEFYSRFLILVIDLINLDFSWLAKYPKTLRVSFFYFFEDVS